MNKSLEYYFSKKEIIEHVIFNKYTIDECGIIRNKKTGKLVAMYKIGEYKRCGVRDDSGKTRQILVARAIASTFLGPPPSTSYTADHKNKNSGDDTIGNIRWLCKSGQRVNQVRSETYKSAFIVVKDGEEKTVNEWVEHLKDQRNRLGREYTGDMIKHCAQKKKYGFSYKEYPNLNGEVWKEIIDSKNVQGRWEISNMSRLKYATKHAENVLSGDRLGLSNGYPRINIDGKIWLCHILAFMTFFPEEYATKKTDETVLHEDDDKLDFRPHKLRLGTTSENGKDAHVNGCRDGTKTARMKCVSYVNGVLEKEHSSQSDAVKYLKSKGWEKASCSAICRGLDSAYKTAYGRTWKTV